MCFNRKRNLKRIYNSNSDNNCRVSVVHFSNELIPMLTVSQLFLHSQLSKFSCAILWVSGLSKNQLLKLPHYETLSHRKTTLSLSLSLSLACAKSPLSLSKCVNLIYTQPTRYYLKQTSLNLLSTHCNSHSKSVTFCRKALSTVQTNLCKIVLCHSTATYHF